MRAAIIKFGATLAAVAAMTVLASCGGGDSSPPPPPPPPAPLTITTASLPGSFYGEFYTTTLQSSGGTGLKLWSITSGSVPGGLNLDHTTGIISGVVSQAGFATATFEVTVTDSSTKVATKTFDVVMDMRPAKILTTSLPNAVLGRPYRVQIATTQPAVPMLLDPNQGAPPPGIFLTSPQTLSGTPAIAGTFTFGVQLITPGPSPGVPDQRTYTVQVVGPGAANRNDDIPNAPSLSTGTYFASISPLVDPVTGTVAAPDNDYYRMTAQPGSTVSIEITAERDGSPLDSVIELVDSAGTRLNTCNSPGESSFTNPCMDDDNLEEGTLDSKLLFRAPSGAPTTLFLHVVDWRGDARPDMQYQFQIFGVD